MRKSNREHLRNEEEFQSFYWTLIHQSGLGRIADYPQHGSTSRLMHSVAVAYYSYCLAKATGLSFHWEELVRGALLHDYFLYDWHQKDKSHSWHGFRHADAALKNAKEDFELSFIEENIIERHMFPLNPKPPACREAWIVCIADKYCAIKEIIG